MPPVPPTYAQPDIDFARVRAVVFDLGNVLLDLDNSIYGNGWPDDIGKDYTDFAQWLVGERLWYRYETGDIDTLDFLYRLHRRLGLSPKHIQTYWNGILRPGIASRRYDTLHRLSRKLPLHVLSNTNAIHIAWVRDHVTEAGHPDFETEFFTHVTYSYHAGAVKPEPGIYEHLEAHVEQQPSGLLFIDDKVENVEAAVARGWQAIWLKPGRPVEEVLQPLLAED